MDDALHLLHEWGASAWLVRHHELVAEAGEELLRGLRPEWLSRRERAAVLLGCALHDAGKIRYPEEQRGPGHLHERAGRELLEEHGVSPEVARFCETHARWQEAPLPDQLVALADKLWKGKRTPELEEQVVWGLSVRAGCSFWELWPELDALFEAVAAGADDRLMRSMS